MSPAESTPPIQLVRSGPSLGPAAATHFLSKRELSPTALLIDVGGTSLDASFILGGRPVQTSETWIGLPYLGQMTGFPSVDIHSLALGGGSILELDNRIIRIGPTSAGSDPGPGCFGKGGFTERSQGCFGKTAKAVWVKKDKKTSLAESSQDISYLGTWG